MFDIASVKPFIGRAFQQSDYVDGAEPVVILSYNAWATYFDSDSSVIGNQLSLDAIPGRIVGVMPEGFSFKFTGEQEEQAENTAFLSTAFTIALFASLTLLKPSRLTE